MANNVITDVEFNQFRNIHFDDKVNSMALYLIGNNGYKFSMQDVGESVFGSVNYSYTVSLIHRCYNFSGQNSGKYKNGCSFEQSTGHRVSRDDIVAFVDAYPDGTFDNGVTFEEFLISTRLKNVRPQPKTSVQQKQFKEPEDDYVDFHAYDSGSHTGTNNHGIRFTKQWFLNLFIFLAVIILALKLALKLVSKLIPFVVSVVSKIIPIVLVVFAVYGIVMFIRNHY